MHRRLLITMSALLFGRSALAEQVPEAAPDYFADLPLVLSASRLVQAVEDAPAAVTVIDRKMIKDSGVRDIADLFRLVPGMVVGRYRGNRPTIGFHGFTDPYFRQLQVLIDGVSVYSPMWGGAEWSELPIALEDIERIEVVRGPNSAAFGANSFLGVVNIITRDPAVERGVQVVANVGENGIGDALVRYAASSDDLRYRLTAGQRSDQGLDAYPDTTRTNFLNLRGHYRVTVADEVRLQAGYSGGVAGEGVYGVPNHTDGPRPRRFDSGSIQLRWTRSQGADDELWLQFSHAERSNREVLPYVLDLRSAGLGAWTYPLSYSYDFRRTDLELQHTLRVGESVRGVWGGQLRTDGARSETYFGSNGWQSSNLSRLFGNLEWRLAAGWVVTGGAMLERNSISGSSVSPSLAVNRQVLPGHTVRLRAASAKRTPTLYEDRVDWGYELPAGLKALLAGVPPLGPYLVTLPLAQSALTSGSVEDENIRSREISYLGHFPGARLNVELHLFRHRLDNLMAYYRYAYPTVMGLFESDYQFTYGFRNSETAGIKGSSVALRWQATPATRIHFAGSRTVIETDSILIEPSAPTHTVSLLVSQDLTAEWLFSFGYYRVGSFQTMGGGALLPATDRADLRFARQFRTGGARGEVALVVQKAFGSLPVFELRDIDRRTSWLSMRLEY